MSDQTGTLQTALQDPKAAKILRSHKAGCFALDAYGRGDWLTPWAFLEKTEERDRRGYRIGNRRGMGDRWWRVRCNDGSCPAEVVVREEALLAHLPVR